MENNFVRNIRKGYIAFLFVLSLLCLNPGRALADKDFRDHRFSSFSLLPQYESEDIVFIGNSITNMMNWDELFVGKKNIYNRGTSGAFTDEILENLDVLLKGNPGKVFLMIGTNDLGAAGEEFAPSKVSERIKEIVVRIKEKSPSTEVYFQSILPTKKGERTQEKTEETNSRVKEWIDAAQLDGVKYIDLYSSFVDDKGDIANFSTSSEEESLSYDGLHLTQKGYKLWADIISPYIGSECTIPADAVNIGEGIKSSFGMRISFFGVFPVESDDILFIGDEMVHNGEWHKYPGLQNLKDRGIGWGYPGAGIDMISKSFAAIFTGNTDKGVSKQKPKGVVIYAGAGDIMKGSPAPETWKKYEDAITRLQGYVPDAPIYLLTLLPLAESEREKNKELSELNGLIRNLAGSSPDLHLIDVAKELTDSEGKREEKYFMNTSSPYLNGLGFQAVADLLSVTLALPLP